MAEKFDIPRRIQFGVEINGLEFDEKTGVWTVRVKGKRVAVIGTGASAVQIVPELVEQAESSRSSSAHAVG